MRISLLFAAIIFSYVIPLAQEVSPNPRRAESVANGPEAKQNNGKDGKNPSTLSPVIDTATSGNTNKKSPEITFESEQRPKEQVVTVRSLPELGVSRDFLDYFSVFVTIILIAIA